MIGEWVTEMLMSVSTYFVIDIMILLHNFSRPPLDHALGFRRSHEQVNCSSFMLCDAVNTNLFVTLFEILRLNWPYRIFKMAIYFHLHTLDVPVPNKIISQPLWAEDVKCASLWPPALMPIVLTTAVPRRPIFHSFPPLLIERVTVAV